LRQLGGHEAVEGFINTCKPDSNLQAQSAQQSSSSRKSVAFDF
jgi:hypothetical protein